MRLIKGAAIWVTMACLGVAVAPLVPSAEDAPKAGDPPAANPVGAGWGANVATDQTTPTDQPALDAKQADAVKKVNVYFNGLDSLQGSFVQTGSDNKRMKGKFYVQRPGRFRFDYALPSKQIIISDGVYLAIQDLDLNNEDRYSLDQTPFRLLLRKDVDLLRDAHINEVNAADDVILLTLQDKDPDAPGKIKLSLATKPNVEIKEWVTTDAQGLDTKVEVSELVKGGEIDPSLFKIQALTKKQLQ